MENFCVAVVSKMGDGAVVIEKFVQVFGAGSFGEVSGSDEDEFSVVVEVEDRFVDKEEVEVGSVIEVGDGVIGRIGEGF